MKHCITISVEEDQEQSLRDMAKRQGRPFSWTAREVLAAGIVALAAADTRACSTPRPSAPKRTRRGKG